MKAAGSLSLRSFPKRVILSVDAVIVLLMLGRWFYISLCEQYYYHRFGIKVLQNTSFQFPNGSFCVSSELIDNSTGDNNSYKIVEAQSNHLMAYGQLASTIPSIVLTMILGPLTDKYGRKVGIVLPAVGLVLQGTLSVFAAHYDLHLYYFVLANFLGGIFGSATSVIAACFSYAADISSPRWRTLRIGIIFSLHSLGGSVGTMMSGFWLYKINCSFVPLFCFYVACNFLMLMYAAFLLPESLSQKEREERFGNNSKGLAPFIQGLKLFCGGLSLVSTWTLYATLLSATVELFNFYGSLIIDVYFLKAMPLDFNSFQIGTFQTVKAASEGLTTLLVMIILTVLSVRDVWIILIAMIAHSTSNLLTGFATQDWQLYLIGALKGIEGLTWSGARGLMSKLVKPGHQGALFSIVAAIQSVTFLTSSAAWPVVFPLTLQHNMRAGMTYVFMAALGFSSLPLLLSIVPLRTAPQPVGKGSADSERPKESTAQPLLKENTKNPSYSSI